MLLNTLKQVVRRVRWAAQAFRGAQGELKSQGPEGIRRLGHREYVGGLWEEIGRLQFNFLLGEGLQPHHYLVDIACGSLRAGVHLIPYLDSGHYLGIDKEEQLIRLGIEKELGTELYDRKKPRFVVSNSFEFEKFDVRPDYALAQSLFTHLPEALIRTCFKRLHQFIRDDGVFYATFGEAMIRVPNPSQPHDHRVFGYTRRQMERFGTESGWRVEYIGQWNHPRGQMMLRCRPA